jgi:hypothetical protein
MRPKGRARGPNHVRHRQEIGGGAGNSFPLEPFPAQMRGSDTVAQGHAIVAVAGQIRRLIASRCPELTPVGDGKAVFARLA